MRLLKTTIPETTKTFPLTPETSKRGAHRGHRTAVTGTGDTRDPDLPGEVPVPGHEEQTALAAEGDGAATTNTQTS